MQHPEQQLPPARAPRWRQARTLGVLAAAITLAGAAVFAVTTFGARADTTVAALQGEAMTTVSGSGSVVTEGGVRALKLHSKGARARGAVDVPTATSGVRVTVAGTPCEGAPRLRILIDGTAALLKEIRSTDYTEYAAALTLRPGEHTITAALTNHYASPACARTVSIDVVTLTGPEPSTRPEPSPSPEPATTSPAPSPAASTTPVVGAFVPFGSASVTADLMVNGAGVDVDTVAFWEAPDPTSSLMFVSSKGIPLVEVWRHPFTSDDDQQPPLTSACLQAGVDSATNGVLVDQESDLLYVASSFSPNVCVFSLPDLGHVRTLTSGASYGPEPNLALIELPTGAKRLYVSDDRVVHVHDAATGALLSQFTPAEGLETMWGDSHDHVLYVPDENSRTGVYAYNPDGTPYSRNGRTSFGDGTIFDSDGEGILEYTCPTSGVGDDGSGLIVVSDQVDHAVAGNDYEVFDRRTWSHLGKIQIRLPTGGLVYNTDGIASTRQQSVEYPAGLLVAIQNDSGVAGVGWSKVLAAISAQVGTTFGCAS